MTEQWGTSPLLKGITQWPTEIMFSAITNCASTVSLAPTRLPWPPRHLSEGYDSCTRSCCRGSNWEPSGYQPVALSTWPSVPPGLEYLPFLNDSVLVTYPSNDFLSSPLPLSLTREKSDYRMVQWNLWYKTPSIIRPCFIKQEVLYHARNLL